MVGSSDTRFRRLSVFVGFRRNPIQLQPVANHMPGQNMRFLNTRRIARTNRKVKIRQIAHPAAAFAGESHCRYAQLDRKSVV